MLKQLSQSQKELLKLACINAALASAEKNGFAAAKELWQATLTAFFSEQPHVRLTSISHYCNQPDTAYRKDLNSCLSKLSNDMAFLELYQQYIEKESLANGAVFKESATWLEIAEQLISLRMIARGLYQHQLFDERMALGKEYLNTGKSEKAIEHLAAILEDELAWEFSSSIGPTLNRSLGIIGLLLSAHELYRKHKKNIHPGENNAGGLPAIDLLLSTYLKKSLTYRLYGGHYDELLLQATCELSRLYQLRGEISNAIECLQTTCNAYTEDRQSLVLGIRGYNKAGILNPQLLPRLWYVLSALQLKTGNPSNAIDAAKTASIIVNRFSDNLSEYLARRNQTKQLNDFLASNIENATGMYSRDFLLYRHLQVLSADIETLLKSMNQ